MLTSGLSADERMLDRFARSWAGAARAVLVDVTTEPKLIYRSDATVSWSSPVVQDGMRASTAWLWLCDDSPEDVLLAWWNLGRHFLASLGASLPPTGGVLLV